MLRCPACQHNQTPRRRRYRLTAGTANGCVAKLCPSTLRSKSPAPPSTAGIPRPRTAALNRRRRQNRSPAVPEPPEWRAASARLSASRSTVGTDFGRPSVPEKLQRRLPCYTAEGRRRPTNGDSDGCGRPPQTPRSGPAPAWPQPLRNTSGAVSRPEKWPPHAVVVAAMITHMAGIVAVTWTRQVLW